MQIQIDLTKELVELLSPDQIKKILLDLIGSNGTSTPSKEDSGLKVFKIENKAIETISSTGSLTLPVKSDDLNEDELTPELFADIKLEYAEGIDLPDLCRKYNVSYNVCYQRLYRQGLIKKKV